MAAQSGSAFKFVGIILAKEPGDKDRDKPNCIRIYPEGSRETTAIYPNDQVYAQCPESGRIEVGGELNFTKVPGRNNNVLDRVKLRIGSIKAAA